MEALFIYIAKSTGLILLFYCAYYFLLRKETFFTSNRWFLLTGLITSVVLPLVVYTKVIWVNPDPVTNLDLPNVVLNQNTENNLLEINWIYITLFVYSIGLLTLLIKFAMDYYNLNSILKGKKIHQQADFKFIDINENIAPFSYFEYIVYNSSMFTETELENIIEHEKVHSDQNHTIDVLISRAFCMLFWFNPIVWLYKKAIAQNLEFIADKEAAKKLSDKKAYQYTLLKITTHESCVAITNHFYQSLIKKRIIMLNKNQSKKRNLVKYCVVVPVLAAFVLLFQVEVIAKEKQQVTKVKVNSGEIESVHVYKINKNSTDAELNKIKESLKKEHNIDFEISDVKRNSDNALTSIKIDIKNGKQQAQSIQTASDKAIKDFGVIVTTEKDGTKKIGIQTSDEKNNAKKEKNTKIITSTKLKNKVNNDDDTNSNVSTKTSTNSGTNISTSVTVSTDDKTVTKNGVTILKSSKTKVKAGSQLIIVDGTEMPSSFDIEDIDPKDIKSVNIYKGADALTKYGERGEKGVIEIETRK